MKWDTCTGFIAIALISSPETPQNKGIKVHFRQRIGKVYINISVETLLTKTLSDVLTIQGLEYSLTRQTNHHGSSITYPAKDNIQA